MSQTTKTVIDIMKSLLLTLLLIGQAALAEGKDSYFCAMTHFSFVTNEGRQTHRLLENFKFQIDSEKQAFVFGSSEGYFAELVLPTDMLYPGVDWYEAKDADSHFKLKGGKAVYTATYAGGATIIAATCSKF